MKLQWKPKEKKSAQSGLSCRKQGASTARRGARTESGGVYGANKWLVKKTRVDRSFGRLGSIVSIRRSE